MKIFFSNKNYLIILFIFLSSCYSNNNDLIKRKPAKNIIMLQKIQAKKLSKEIEENTKPKVKPQFTEQNNNKKTSFYQTLFNSKNNLIIKDEIANNNIKKIKQEITTKNKSKPTTEKQIKNKNYFFVQVGAYSVQENANNILLKLQKKYSKIQTEKSQLDNKEITKVKIGPLTSLVEAEEVKKQLANQGFNKTIIIHNK